MASVIFFVYFITEWLPIFVIYLNHFLAFYGIIRRHKLRCQTELSNATAVTTVDQEMTADMQQQVSRRDEFAMLIANVPRSPSSSGH